MPSNARPGRCERHEHDVDVKGSPHVSDYVCGVLRRCHYANAVERQADGVKRAEIKKAEGKQDELVGRIQKRTGETREAVEKAIKNACSSSCH